MRSLAAVLRGVAAPFAWLFDLMFPSPFPYEAVAVENQREELAKAAALKDEEDQMAEAEFRHAAEIKRTADEAKRTAARRRHRDLPPPAPRPLLADLSADDEDDESLSLSLPKP
jgi:hypothetical protein